MEKSVKLSGNTIFAVVTFILIGAAMACFGAFQLNKHNALFRDCTSQTEGVVADIDVSTNTDADGSTSTNYYPIFEYELNGKIYRNKSNVSSRSLSIGQQATVLYDPAAPDRFYAPEFADATSLLFIIIICVGGFWFIVGIVVAIKEKTAKG